MKKFGNFDQNFAPNKLICIWMGHFLLGKLVHVWVQLQISSSMSLPKSNLHHPPSRLHAVYCLKLKLMKYHFYVTVSEIEWGAIYNMVWYHCWWHFYISVDRKVVRTAASRYLHLNWWFESCYLLLILVLMKYIAFYYCIGCWWLTQPSFSDLFVDEVACIWQILIHLRPRKKNVWLYSTDRP